MSTKERIKNDIKFITKNGKWLVFQRFFGLISVLSLSIVFANFLPKSTFGIYKNILAWGALLMIPTLGGMSQSTIRSIAQGFHGTATKIFSTKLRWGSLTFLLASTIGAYYIFQGNSTIGISYIILGILYPLNESSKIFNAVLTGQKEYKSLALYTLSIRITSVIILITTVFFTKNATLIILANVLPLTILNTIAYIHVKKKNITNTKTDAVSVSYGKHLSVVNILATVAQKIDSIILFQYGAIEVAVYSIAIAPVENINWINKSIKTLSLPSLSKKTKEEIRQHSKRRATLILGFISLIALTYIIAAPFIFRILFSQYMESVLYSQLYATTIIARSLGAYFTSILEAKMAKKMLYKLNIGSSIISITLTFILIPIFGILGAVAAKVCAHTLRMGLSGYFVKKL